MKSKRVYVNLLKTMEDEAEQRDRISIDVEKSIDPRMRLANSIEEELQSLTPLSGERCIFRVPTPIRILNEGAFTPQVVSIGPLHHEQEHLKPMEEHKRRFLRDFLERSGKPIQTFVYDIKEKEETLRSYYAETIAYDSDEFVTMVLTDAGFILELFLKYELKDSRNDFMFGPPGNRLWVRTDLYMLENQLPFFILEDLLELAGLANHTSVTKLALTFAANYGGFVEPGYYKNQSFSAPLHNVDMLRTLYRPSIPLRIGRTESVNARSALELHQAGVKFRRGSRKSLLDIRFTEGVLEIPLLRLTNSTEKIMRNILAFEQCYSIQSHGSGECFINDYLIFMRQVVLSPKDVEVLIRSNIIADRTKGNENVSSLFQNLAHDTVSYSYAFHFAGLVDDLNNYCDGYWHRWKATLKQDYFSTPWAALSVIAAVILLLLTIVQATTSIMQVT